MNLPHRWKHLGITALMAAALTAFATLSAAPSLRADDQDCQKRISRADHKLHDAIEHHGYRSSQADRARHDLAEAREQCWTSYHKWWDEDDQRWHTDRDWRDEDHEHYGERDRRDPNDRDHDRDEHPRDNDHP
jgi:hypothetical protein